MIWGPDGKLFTTALAGSCLLHAAVILTPYLGGGRADSLLAVAGGQPTRMLTVRVLDDAGRAVAVPPKPAPEVSVRTDALRPAPPPPSLPGVLPIPAPTYYTSDQLTKRPRPTSEPRLDVPASAPSFASGKVVLKLWISELGGVVSADVENSDVPEAVATAAKAAFGKVRFEPGEVNGRRVGAVMRIEVSYDEEMKVDDDGLRPRQPRP